MGNVLGRSTKISKLSGETEESKRAKALAQKKQWLDCAAFIDLPQEGREAFVRYTKDRNYNTDSRRLEFWFASPEESAVTPFLTKYLSDGEEQLPEVRETDDVEDMIEHAREIDAYVSELKDRMRPRLNELFRKFKEFISDELQREH